MNDPLVVKAAPTKRFFISVLVKDIHLIDALVELVDNSVDSARSDIGTDKLRQVHIEIDYDAQSFSIKDNAAGISIEQARNYAFRFGRPGDAPVKQFSVGEFGVGMKRALFKLGRHFDISSKTSNEFFSILLDVDEWEAVSDEDPNAWHFRFDKTGTNQDPKDTGTKIVVTKLHSYACEEFQSSNFGTRLAALLKETHAESLANGLQIIINKKSIHAESATLLESDDIQSMHIETTLKISNKEVTVKIFAGIGEPRLVDAGWYVFCNGRLIERAEKTEKTGWNSAIDGEQTPKPHWQFRRFRGYAFFESQWPDVLPWNTTKTSLDVEAPAYRQIKSDMSSALRQVIAFLNSLDAEASEAGPLSAAVEAATPLQLLQIKQNKSFVYQVKSAKAQPKEAQISYKKPSDMVNQVKRSLEVKSNREVGEKTFDYYVESEGLDGK